MVRFPGRLSRKTACVRLNGDDHVVTDTDSLNVVGCFDGLDVGQTIGGYEVVALLGASPTGVKYKVRNVLMHRLEVLKVLPGKSQEDEQLVERFHREVAIRSRLSHSNIVSFYNAMTLGDRIVMTTEWIEGSTLEQLFRRGAIPLKEAVNYVFQALSALVYAHANGVVHRNLTPSCVIITPQGKLKLGEFELAKKYIDPRLTQTGTALAAREYASPEQVNGETRLDERSDIYSMGVILFELVTGRKPFAAKGQFEIMGRVSSRGRRLQMNSTRHCPMN